MRNSSSIISDYGNAGRTGAWVVDNTHSFGLTKR